MKACSLLKGVGLHLYMKLQTLFLCLIPKPVHLLQGHVTQFLALLLGFL